MSTPLKDGRLEVSETLKQLLALSERDVRHDLIQSPAPGQDRAILTPALTAPNQHDSSPYLAKNPHAFSHQSYVVAPDPVGRETLQFSMHLTYLLKRFEEHSLVPFVPTKDPWVYLFGTRKLMLTIQHNQLMVSTTTTSFCVFCFLSFFYIHI